MSASNSTENTAVLRVEELSCRRGRNLLFQNFSFDLSAGECLHLGGANGAGKTTVLRIVAGLREADSGNVEWRGENIRRSEAFHRDIAYVGHEPGLKAELTAWENLKVAAALLNLPDAAVEQALARVRLMSRAHLPVAQLSAGQTRRAALARLLLGKKRLWLLDEPLTALDVPTRELVVSLLEEHCANGGAALLTSHQGIESESLNLRRLELAG